MAREGHPILVVIRQWTPEPYFFDAFRQANIRLAFKEDDPRQALATFQPDLVVVNIGDQDEGTPWYATCQEQNLPYVILNHLTKEPRYWPVRPEVQEAVREGNRLARQVFFTSRNNRRLMEKRLGCPIPHAGLFHNPLFIRRDLQLPFPPLDGPLRLAMPSRLLTIHKGQHIALQVFAWKKWRRRNIQLHIYGKGPDEASLRETVAREKLHNVFFHEPEWQLPNPDMAAIWRDNHALLMTSFMEGMPLVLLNAMFHARVPIVTDIGGHREVVEDGDSGFIAAEPTAQAVDAALEQAWRNRAAWPAIGLRAKERMLRFTPEDPIADLVAKLLHLTGN
jgi:glycosyltransferase involved in cell wall biosynthesis